MHKTGSTSIQETLKNYFRDGVKYANMGPSNHSVPIMTIFSENRYSYGNHAINGRTVQEIDEMKVRSESLLLADLKNKEINKLIISGEEMSYLSKNSVLSLKDFLSEFAEKITILAYIRNPLDFSNSALQQIIKGGYKSDKIPQPSYRERFEKYLEIFGRENINFRLFDKKKLLDGSVVLDFCDWVGIPPGSIPEKTMNEGVPDEVVRLIYLFNKEGSLSVGRPELMKARNEMFRVLSKYFSSKFRLPRDLLLKSMDDKDVAWMANLSGFDLIENSFIDEKKNEVYKSLNDYLCKKDDLDFMENLLKSCLTDEGVKFSSSDNLLSLFNKLYHKFLLIEHKKIVLNEHLSSRGVDLADLISEKALALSGKNIRSAYVLMRAAQILKPKDEFIKSKVSDYQSLIDVNVKLV